MKPPSLAPPLLQALSKHPKRVMELWARLCTPMLPLDKSVLKFFNLVALSNYHLNPVMIRESHYTGQRICMHRGGKKPYLPFYVTICSGKENTAYGVELVNFMPQQ